MEFCDKEGKTAEIVYCLLRSGYFKRSCANKISFFCFQVKRMLYWMPKLRYSNKYLDRRNVEGREGSVNLEVMLLFFK